MSEDVPVAIAINKPVGGDVHVVGDDESIRHLHEVLQSTSKKEPIIPTRTAKALFSRPSESPNPQPNSKSQEEILADMDRLRQFEPKYESVSSEKKKETSFMFDSRGGEFTATHVIRGESSTYIDKRVKDNPHIVGQGKEIAVVQHVDSSDGAVNEDYRVTTEILTLRRDTKGRLFGTTVPDDNIEQTLNDAIWGGITLFTLKPSESGQHYELSANRDIEWRVKVENKIGEGSLDLDDLVNDVYPEDRSLERIGTVDRRAGVPEMIHMSYQNSEGTELRMATTDTGPNKESKRLPIMVTREQIRRSGGRMHVVYDVNTAASDVQLEPRMVVVSEADGEVDVMLGEKPTVHKKSFIKAIPVPKNEALALIRGSISGAPEDKVDIFSADAVGRTARVYDAPSNPYILLKKFESVPAKKK